MAVLIISTAGPLAALVPTPGPALCGWARAPVGRAPPACKALADRAAGSHGSGDAREVGACPPPQDVAFAPGEKVAFAPGEKAATPLTMADLKSIVGSPKVVLLRKYTKATPHVEAGTVGLFQGISGSDAHVDFPGRRGACPPPQDIAFAPDEKAAATSACRQTCSKCQQKFGSVPMDLASLHQRIEKQVRVRAATSLNWRRT